MNIIDRIQKLWNLSQRNNSTDEAALAAAKAQELCFQHNLELEKVLAAGLSGQKKEQYVRFDYMMPDATRTDVGWKRQLFGSVCRANFCKAVIIPRTSQMAVVGQKSNFEVVCYMYEYLVKEIQRLAIKTCMEKGFLSNKDRRKYVQGFCEGAMATVYRKLEATQKTQAAANTESRELVVVKDKELASATHAIFPYLRKGNRRTIGGSSDAYGDGAKAGHNITVNRGVGQSSRTLIG